MPRPPDIVRELGSTRAPAYGFVGTSVYAIDEPPDLRWPLAAYVYDKMARHYQLAAIDRAVTLPILSARWSLEQGAASEEATRLCAEDLQLPILGQEAQQPRRSGRRSRFSWATHLRQALRSMRYAQFFEQVYYLDGDRVRLRKLAPRPMITLADIVADEDGGLAAIKQYRPTANTSANGSALVLPSTARSSGGSLDNTVTIPVDKLVAYVHNQEAGDWTGVQTSIYRPAFGPWLLHERAMRRWAIIVERGAGVPIFTGPEGVNPGDAVATALHELATMYSIGEASGGFVPHGTTYDLNMPSGRSVNPEDFIRVLDQAMAKAVLAQWLELGMSREGSRALSYSWLDIFRLSLHGVMREITDTANNHIIADLIEHNYGPDESAPRIVFAQANLEESLPPGDLAALVKAGLIIADEPMRRWTRQRYGAPEEDGSEPRAMPDVSTDRAEDEAP